MQDTIFLRISIGFFEFDLSAGVQVGFVTGEGNDHIGVTPSLQFLDPRLGSRERVGIGNIVYNNGSCGASVVHGS